MQIFHYNRRDLIAKTFFDIFKLTAVAGCVSGFFPELDSTTRIGIFYIIGSCFLLGLTFCPMKQKE